MKKFVIITNAFVSPYEKKYISDGHKCLHSVQIAHTLESTHAKKENADVVHTFLKKQIFVEKAEPIVNMENFQAFKNFTLSNSITSAF